MKQDKLWWGLAEGALIVFLCFVSYRVGRVRGEREGVKAGEDIRRLTVEGPIIQWLHSELRRNGIDVSGEYKVIDGKVFQLLETER